MITELCKLAYKYGSDKCPQIRHTYTPFYFNLLNKRRHEIKKVVEIGIGSSKTMNFNSPHYVTGASLRMWRDFFPNATIYGADIDSSMMFSDERIKTFTVDETNADGLIKLIEQIGNDIDLFIDDGLHSKDAQISLCKTVLPLLWPRVTYIIEDVGFPRTIANNLPEFTCEIPDLTVNKEIDAPKNRLMLVKKKFSEITQAIFKNTGSPFEIPNVSRDDIPTFFKDRGYKVGAEIGVYKAEFSLKLMSAGLQLYGIDPWEEYDGYKITKGQERLNLQYLESKKVFDQFPQSKLIRKTSMEAVKDFADNSLDFVYIDGNHEFKYVAEDLCEWSKKVRPGGVVSGHDYFFTKPKKGKQFWHVGYVLKAYTAAFGINNWYVIGRLHKKQGEVRDKYRSWMFIK